MTTAIRDFRSSDLEQCVGAFVTSYNCEPWNYDWSYTQAKQYLIEYLTSPRFQGFVAEYEDEIVGVLFGQAKTWLDQNQFFIDELFVLPRSRGKGLAGAILNHVELFCKQSNLSVMYGMTSRHLSVYNFLLSKNFIQSDQWVVVYRTI